VFAKRIGTIALGDVTNIRERVEGTTVQIRNCTSVFQEDGRHDNYKAELLGWM